MLAAVNFRITVLGSLTLSSVARARAILRLMSAVISDKRYDILNESMGTFVLTGEVVF